MALHADLAVNDRCYCHAPGIEQYGQLQSTREMAQQMLALKALPANVCMGYVVLIEEICGIGCANPDALYNQTLRPARNPRLTM